MVENLTELSDESEESLLCSLSNRFLNKRIYTQLGDNLIFVNPNESLPIYDESVVNLYAQSNDRRQYRHNSIAHIFAIAAKAQQNIENGSRHESIVFCGESGSGKTTNFYHSLRFLCSSESSKIKSTQIDALQKICESFGSARSLKNNCSTRFGCLANLTLRSGAISAFSISAAIPLELSRLVSQRRGDYNFGILYQLCAGLSAEERNKYGIKQASNYFYLNQGKCNLNNAEEEKKFKNVRKALSIIGFSEDQKELIYSVLSAVLHIGNIFFYTQKTNDNEEYAEIANENVLQWVAYLLSIDYAVIKGIFASSLPANLQNRTGENSSPKNLKSVDAALDLRDAFAKILYNDLFGWILSRISLFFQCSNASQADSIDGRITLFDMFGFEKYNNNSYEEFCVNAANERLEQFYLQKTFAPLLNDPSKNNNEENSKDNNDSGRQFPTPTLLTTNRRVVEFLTKRPSGVIPLLDDECKFPKGSDETLFQHCNLNHLDKSIYVKPRVKERLEFGVKHSAGTVFYNLEGFLAKNRWTRPAAVTAALRESKDAILVFVFGGGGGGKRCISSFHPDSGGDENGLGDEEDQTLYIASQLSKSLNVTLEKLQSSNCFFIRCIRSNGERQPNKFDFAAVQRQIRAFCALETCQMLRHAFVRRFTFDAFADEMRCLLPDEVTRGKSAFETSRAVLDTQGADAVAEARLGVNCIFMKERLWRQLLELKEFTRNVAALILQRNFRKWLSAREFARFRNATVRLQAAYRGWKARKIVASRKEKLMETIRNQSALSKKTSNGFDSSDHASRMSAQNEKNQENVDSLCSELPEILQKQFEESEKCPMEAKKASGDNVRQTTQYLPIKSTTPKPIVNAVSIEEFAEQNLKHHVLGARREPIFAPFLPKVTEEEFETSINIFKLILAYMNSVSLSANKLTILAKFIMQKGIDDVSQRDEIYVQLCNQTYRNCSDASANRAWNLLLMAVNSFPPGILVFPMLYSYFQNARPAALSNLLINGLTRPLVASNPASRSRLFAPSKLEQVALCRKQPAVLSAKFCNGDSFATEADSWTTVKEFTQRILRHKGIGDSAGWCLELAGGGEITQISEGQYLFDAVAQFEVPNARGATGETNPFVFCAEMNPAMKQKRFQNKDYSALSFARSSNGIGSNNLSSVKSPPFSPVLEKRAPTKNAYSFGDSSTNSNASYIDEEERGEINDSTTKLRRYDLRFSPMLRDFKANGTPSPSENESSGYAFPRRQNPNCMSRITEEEFAMDAASREATLQRSHRPKDYSTMSIASRIRNMSVPTHNGDVDKFLDDVFNKALPPTDYDANTSPYHSNNNSLNRRDLVEKIAASIKGGQRHEDDFSYFNNSEADDKDYTRSPPASFRSPPSSSPLTSPPSQRAEPPTRYSYRTPQNFSHHHHHGQNAANDAEGNRRGMRMDNRQQSSAAGNRQFSQELPRNNERPFRTHASHNSLQQPAALTRKTTEFRPSRRFDTNATDSTLNSNFWMGTGTFNCHDQRQFPSTNGGEFHSRTNSNEPSIMSPSSLSRQEHFGGGLRRYPPSSNAESLYNTFNGAAKQPSLKSASDKHTAEVRGDYYFAARPASRNSSMATRKFAMSPPYDVVESSSTPRQSGQPLRRSATDANNNNIYGGIPGDDDEAHNVFVDGVEDEVMNDWVHEAELSYTDTIASLSRFGNDRSKSGNEKTLSKKENENSNEAAQKQQQIPILKGRPAVEFLDEPFSITVRKEIFAVDEELDDGVEIDLIFAQIISDCHRNIPHRIRKYERETINQILRSYKVRPSSLEHLSEIATKVKIQVIDAARKWPLYFCRFYPIIEERPNDRIPLFLGISETGIRLISYNGVNNSSNSAQQSDPVIIQDHFEYSDISELVIENQKSLRLITRQSISVLVTSIHAPVIKKCIEQYISGTVMNKEFVVTTAEYSTKEANLLSFERGQFIQLMDGPDTKCPVSGNWLYGKLENMFGWFPADYVQPVAENQYEGEFQQSAANNNNNPLNQQRQTQLPGQLSSPSLDPLYTDFHSEGPNGNAAAVDELYGFASGFAESGESERFTMAEFAVRFFRRPKHFQAGETFSLQRKKKDWTWKEITDKVKFTDHPITHSLLRLESAETDKLAVDAFLCIMRYMGDENLKRSQTLTDCVYELLSICHRYMPLRDEVYCQMLKQLTANRSTRRSSEESQVRGWRLLTILTAYFPCSSTLKPYIVKYLSDIAYDERRVFHGIAKQCLNHLAQSFRYGGRRFILSAAEVEATTNGKNVRRQVYHMPGGHRRVIYTRAVTVVEQIMQELCLEMNVRSAEEQQEFSLCYILEKDNTMKTLNNDEYVLDVVTELEARESHTDYILILTRSVWIHPLRQDSQLYTDALFFQIMPNYIAGLLTSLCNGNVTAATLSDVTHLGALLLLSDPLSNCVDEISAGSIASLVPKTILRYGALSPEKWAERIRSKVHQILGDGNRNGGDNVTKAPPPPQKYTPIRARQEFLEIVGRWSLFGAAFFFVRRAITKRQSIMECVIAINKHGVRILTNETHECLAHYPLNEIETTNKYSVSESHFIELRFTPQAAQTYGFDVFTVETDLGLEIARVVGQYLYLSRGGNGDSEPIYILNGSEDSTNRSMN